MIYQILFNQRIDPFELNVWLASKYLPEIELLNYIVVLFIIVAIFDLFARSRIGASISGLLTELV